MKWPRALLVLVPFLALACSSPSIVGTWKADFRGIVVDLRFNADGTLTGNGSFDNQTLALKGTYELHEDQIDIRLKEAQGSSPLLQIISQRIVGDSESGRLEWKNDHEFIVTAASKPPVAFERIEDKT